MGAAVSLSIGGLVYNGLRGQPEVCDMCGGNGGTKCFACGGSGEVAGVGIKVIPLLSLAPRVRGYAG